MLFTVAFSGLKEILNTSGVSEKGTVRLLPSKPTMETLWTGTLLPELSGFSQDANNATPRPMQASSVLKV